MATRREKPAGPGCSARKISAIPPTATRRSRRYLPRVSTLSSKEKTPRYALGSDARSLAVCGSTKVKGVEDATIARRREHAMKKAGWSRCWESSGGGGVANGAVD